MDLNFEKFEKKLDDIERRVADIESASCQLSDVTSSSSSSDSTSGTRKKRSPSDLQFKIRAVHSSFNECNQLHSHERIDSEHNRKVVVSVIKELSDGYGYSAQQIREYTAKHCMKRKRKNRLMI